MKHTPPNKQTREEYVSVEALSFSGMKELDVSPANYAFWLSNPPKRTAALTLGLLTHCILLEPQAVDQRYAVAPEDAPKRPSIRQREAKKPSPDTLAAIAFWDEFEKLSAGKDLVTASELETARSVAASAMLYLSRHGFEHILDERESWIERPLHAKADARTPVKCIPDIIDRDGIIWDLKTTIEDLDDDSVWSLIHKRRYSWQAHHYLGVAKLHRPDIQGFRNLFTRTDGFMDASAVIIDGEPLEKAGKECARLYSLYDRCVQSGKWQGFTDRAPRSLASMQRFPSNPASRPLGIASPTAA
jgi:exodeoxyribonuclease VIII